MPHVKREKKVKVDFKARKREEAATREFTSRLISFLTPANVYTFLLVGSEDSLFSIRSNNIIPGKHHRLYEYFIRQMNCLIIIHIER